MFHTMSYSVTLLTALIVLFSACTEPQLQPPPVTGTSDESVISAKVYNPDLTPAADVNIRFFDVDDTSRIPHYMTTTDSNGKYSVEEIEGSFNVMIGDENLGAFQDSVIIRELFNTLEDDTLELTAVLAGTVGLDPAHNPQTVTVQIIGTDKYANVAEDGTFYINGLAAGDYLLRSISTIGEYTPTYTEFSVDPKQSDTTRLSVSLIYTGIPTVTNLSVEYDTVMGKVTLSWDPVSFRDFEEFVIHRTWKNTLTATTGNEYATTKDTVFNEYISPRDGENLYYRVSVKATTLMIGTTIESVHIVPRERFTMQLNDKIGYFGEPTRVSMITTGYRENDIEYSWQFNGTGDFIASSRSDTVITPGGSFYKVDMCVGRMVVDNRLVLTDTAYLEWRTRWERKGSLPERIDGFNNVIELNGTLYADKYVFLNFSAQSPEGWKSTDMIAWTKIVDTLPFWTKRRNYSNITVFKEKACLIDMNGYLWISSDFIHWDSSAAPVCSTTMHEWDDMLHLGNTKPSLSPPSLFVWNNYLVVQPFPGTEYEDSLLFTKNLQDWDVRPIDFGGGISGYAQVGDTSYLCGFRTDVPYDWMKRFDGTEVTDLSHPGIEDYPQYTYDNFMRMYADNHFRQCIVYGDLLLYKVRENPLSIYTISDNTWHSMPLPVEDRYCNLLTFKGTVYLLGDNCIYTPVSP